MRNLVGLLAECYDKHFAIFYDWKQTEFEEGIITLPLYMVSFFDI